MAQPTYTVNGGAEIPVAVSDWQRVPIRHNPDGTTTYSPWAINRWQVPSVKMVDFLNIYLEQGNALTTLLTNDITDRNIGMSYDTAILEVIEGGQHRGLFMQNVNFEFRVLLSSNVAKWESIGKSAALGAEIEFFAIDLSGLVYYAQNGTVYEYNKATDTHAIINNAVNLDVNEGMVWHSGDLYFQHHPGGASASAIVHRWDGSLDSTTLVETLPIDAAAANERWLKTDGTTLISVGFEAEYTRYSADGTTWATATTPSGGVYVNTGADNRNRNNWDAPDAIRMLNDTGPGARFTVHNWAATVWGTEQTLAAPPPAGAWYFSDLDGWGWAIDRAAADGVVHFSDNILVSWDTQNNAPENWFPIPQFGSLASNYGLNYDRDGFSSVSVWNDTTELWSNFDLSIATPDGMALDVAIVKFTDTDSYLFFVNDLNELEIWQRNEVLT